MNWLYLIFSFGNILGFIIIGSLIAYFVKRYWKKLKNIPTRKFILIVALFSVFGGLSGVLVNGLGQITNALGNMFFASLFAVFEIAFFSLTNKVKA